MTSREEKIFTDIKKLANYDMVRNIAVLKRKLKAMEESRNEWREAAQRYQKTIIELKNKLHEKT
ncbi:hypothetical protein UFOVP147_13 [uncultured Caudovirales phage]|uniref:Uncharacterized protein n=1 Tax=uncultured Caudovirales phage TaxID=2100421 RepID=A0A6J7W1H4_9CAUD|nr:hypothetical protein UFOVP147_13 [uncultured Caudovirales phage]